MSEVTAVCFHTAIQTFSRLINSVVDNGLLHTGPRSDQTRMRYTNRPKQVSKLTKEAVKILTFLIIQGLKKITSISVRSSQMV